MRTTTITHGGFMHHRLSAEDYAKARADYRANLQRVLEIFTTTHGCSSDNIVSDTTPDNVSSFDPSAVTRAWPDLATAQAWVDFVLAENLDKDLEFPILFISTQVDPE
jgi:hypothetical protein